MSLTIGLINASLPSYFPQRHGVFTAARQMLDRMAGQGGHTIVEATDIPMDATQARVALAEVKAAGADFILLLHGGFTMAMWCVKSPATRCRWVFGRRRNRR